MPNCIGLAKTYHPLLSKVELERAYACYKQDGNDLPVSKYELHKRINKYLWSNYAGEAQLKYKLAAYFRLHPYQAGFEVKIDNSRADFLAINGSTKCFEVKSERDNLDLLHKQLADYLRVFEYVYVVSDSKHVAEIAASVDTKIGVWTFKGAKKVEIRPAILNTSLEPFAQIQLLNKSERIKTFRTDAVSQIEANFDPVEINRHFKDALKGRYLKRWNFVKTEWKHILPYDLQFFFNKNVSPNLIYNT